MIDKKEGWHFLKGDKRLRYEPHTLIEPGMTVEAVGDIVVCKNGCHASERILDALKYAPGSLNLWACRVMVQGEIQKDNDKFDDKFVGRKRTCLWMVEVTDILHEFGCRCVEDALSQVDSPDPRSLAAIAAKRAWLRDEISDEELAVARAAAYAVSNATRYATDAAGYAAYAAGYAAYALANTATGYAAYALANTAADVAKYAAYADRCAAWEEAWNKYNQWLEEMVTDARKDGQAMKLKRRGKNEISSCC